MPTLFVKKLVSRRFHTLVRDTRCLLANNRNVHLNISSSFQQLLQASHYNAIVPVASAVHMRGVRHFSSLGNQYTKRRSSKEEDESIFGDLGSSFGSAVPTGKSTPSGEGSKDTEKSTESAAHPSTSATSTASNATTNTTAQSTGADASQTTAQTSETNQHKFDKDYDEDFEIIEEKNTSIPREVYQWIFLLIVAGALGYTIYNYNDLEEYIKTKVKEWRSPVTEIFLPPIPDNVPQEQRKPVLVLNVDDLLLHVHYDGIQYGTRVQKRPYLKEFLEELNKYYEIVLFADSSIHFLAESLMKLEQTVRFESHKLGLEFTTGSGRGIVKDLSRLGRPLSDVVFIEWKRNAYKFQPNNTIVIPRWKGETTDTLLRDILPFLVSLAQVKGQSDYREILKKWGESKDGEAAPVEKILSNYNSFLAQVREQEEKKKSGWFGRLFGK